MAETNYKPNSDKYKAEQEKLKNKQLEKVTTGETKIKKKGAFSKFIELFIPESKDDIENYILSGVLVPLVKKAIIDSISGIFNGGTSFSSDKRAEKTSYSSYYSSGSRPKSSDIKGKTINPICFTSRGDAEIVLDQMVDTLSEYGWVSVADMLDLAGITAQYTDAKYGWYDLRGSRIIPRFDGYYLDLPRAVPYTE